MSYLLVPGHAVVCCHLISGAQAYTLEVPSLSKGWWRGGVTTVLGRGCSGEEIGGGRSGSIAM